MVLAQADKKTLIIDGDLRDPTMHSMFGMRNRTGVVNVLAGEHDLSEVWKEPLPGLKVAPQVRYHQPSGTLKLRPFRSSP